MVVAGEKELSMSPYVDAVVLILACFFVLMSLAPLLTDPPEQPDAPGLTETNRTQD
jgi:hypothetical protein